MGAVVSFVQKPGRYKNVQNIRTCRGYSHPALMLMPGAAVKVVPDLQKYNKSFEPGPINHVDCIVSTETRPIQNVQNIRTCREFSSPALMLLPGVAVKVVPDLQNTINRSNLGR